MVGSDQRFRVALEEAVVVELLRRQQLDELAILKATKVGRFAAKEFGRATKLPFRSLKRSIRTLKRGKAVLKKAHAGEERARALKAHLTAKGRLTPKRKEIIRRAIKKSVSRQSYGHTSMSRAKKSLKTRVPQVVGPGTLAVSTPGGMETGVIGSNLIRHGKKAPRKLAHSYRTA